MTEEQRRARAIQWLEVICKDLQDLLLDQHIFQELQEIVRQNPRFAPASGLFTQWMASGYAQATAVGIRRHIKNSQNSISLKRLLVEVKTYPALVSRQYYISLYQAASAPVSIGEGHFDDVAGEGNNLLPSTLFDQQIQDFEQAAASIEYYVDKRLAHYDTVALARPTPTFGDISEALKVMEKIVIFYLNLLQGKGYDHLLPTIQFDWQNIFRFAWSPIPPSN